jgi:hypothetical protein
MIRHRFRELLDRPVVRASVRLVGVSANGFMACPLVVQEWAASRACQWDVYQRAWQQALELTRPSVLDRCRATLAN